MADETLTRDDWADSLDILAGGMEDVAHVCPICGPKAEVMCPDCEAVWHQAHVLRSVARGVRERTTPDIVLTIKPTEN